jgi:hypothetical protein
MALFAILLVGCNTIPVFVGIIYSQNTVQQITPDRMALLSLITY